MRPLGLALAALSVLSAVGAAILVSPHAVFIDSRARSGQVVLVNAGAASESVEVELKFGFPETDSTGAPSIRMIEEPGPEFPSAARWIVAFPRRAVVRPGERQLVRLLAQPPADLPPGEYWTRLVVTSRSAGPEADSARTGVALVVRTITSVTYRNGEVSTGVTLDDYQAQVEGDSLVAWVALTRQGNAAYLGTIRIRLRDAQDRVMAQLETPIAVYYGIRRRLAFALDSVPPGSYVAALEISTARSDLSPADVLPAPTIRRSARVDKR